MPDESGLINAGEVERNLKLAYKTPSIKATQNDFNNKKGITRLEPEIIEEMKLESRAKSRRIEGFSLSNNSEPINVKIVSLPIPVVKEKLEK